MPRPRKDKVKKTIYISPDVAERVKELVQSGALKSFGVKSESDFAEWAFLLALKIISERGLSPP